MSCAQPIFIQVQAAKEVWLFFLLAAEGSSCGFFGGAKDTAKKKQREGCRKNTPPQKNGSSQACVEWTFCTTDRPQRTRGPLGWWGVWAQCVGLTWQLCPRQITSGAAVTVGLYQDKQPCFKINACPLRPFHLIYIHISTQSKRFPFTGQRGAGVTIHARRAVCIVTLLGW